MADWLAQLYELLLPLILTAVAAVLTQALTAAARVARERWGIEIEARHREALHSALMSGIRAALSRGASGTAAIYEAIDYTRNSVPDAMASLNPSSGVLRELAEAKLREATA